MLLVVLLLNSQVLLAQHFCFVDPIGLRFYEILVDTVIRLQLLNLTKVIHWRIEILGAAPWLWLLGRALTYSPTTKGIQLKNSKIKV
jgi:hypothetical protein